MRANKRSFPLLLRTSVMFATVVRVGSNLVYLMHVWKLSRQLLFETQQKAAFQEFTMINPCSLILLILLLRVSCAQLLFVCTRTLYARKNASNKNNVCINKHACAYARIFPRGAIRRRLLSSVNVHSRCALFLIHVIYALRGSNCIYWKSARLWQQGWKQSETLDLIINDSAHLRCERWAIRLAASCARCWKLCTGWFF